MVVGYWELIPKELGAELSAPQDTSTVMVANEIPASKKQNTSWWTEDIWTRIKKYLVNSRYPYMIRQFDEACLELGFDTVTKQTVFNVLQRIDRNPIKYENDFPMKKRELLSER